MDCCNPDTCGGKAPALRDFIAEQGPGPREAHSLTSRWNHQTPATSAALIGSAVVSGAGRDGCIRCDFGNPIELWETSTRLRVLTLLFIAAALLSASIAASAQSARSYRFCAIYYGIDATGTPSCSFDNREQCMETISGIGGFCIANQYYHGAAVQPPRRVHVMRKRPSTHSHQTSLR
jgi:hypothetical protein